MPTAVAHISGEHVEGFACTCVTVSALAVVTGASTANTYRAFLLQCFNWPLDEGERADNPVAG